LCWVVLGFDRISLSCLFGDIVINITGGNIGTWGTSIFSDDLACDLRDGYRDLVGDGLTGQQATDALLKEYRDDLADPDVAPVFWLALAATQWRCGRLESRVQTQALEVIDDGSDLVRWQEVPQLFEKRRVILGRLRETLLSPQPAAKRIPRRFRNTCDWDIGEIIGYRMLSGKLVMFRLIGYHTDKGGTAPVFEILDWIGLQIPGREELEPADIITWSHDCTQLMVGRVSKRELPRDRVIRLGMILKPKQTQVQSYIVTLWRWLDRDLERILADQ